MERTTCCLTGEIRDTVLMDTGQMVSWALLYRTQGMSLPPTHQQSDEAGPAFQQGEEPGGQDHEPGTGDPADDAVGQELGDGLEYDGEGEDEGERRQEHVHLELGALHLALAGDLEALLRQHRLVRVLDEAVAGQEVEPRRTVRLRQPHVRRQTGRAGVLVLIDRLQHLRPPGLRHARRGGTEAFIHIDRCR